MLAFVVLFVPMVFQCGHMVLTCPPDVVSNLRMVDIVRVVAVCARMVFVCCHMVLVFVHVVLNCVLVCSYVVACAFSM